MGGPEQLLGAVLQLPCADALQEQLADGRVHRRLAALVLVEEGKGDAPFPEPGDTQFREETMGGPQVPGVMAVAVAAASGGPFVAARAHLSVHLRLQEAFQERPEAPEEVPGDLGPDCRLHVLRDLDYSRRR